MIGKFFDLIAEVMTDDYNEAQKIWSQIRNIDGIKNTLTLIYDEPQRKWQESQMESNSQVATVKL